MGRVATVERRRGLRLRVPPVGRTRRAVAASARLGRGQRLRRHRRAHGNGLRRLHRPSARGRFERDAAKIVRGGAVGAARPLVGCRGVGATGQPLIAYSLGKEKRGLVTALTFPRFAEATRGEYLTEDQCLAICTQFRAKVGATVKADLFRLAYLLGIRKGQLRRTCKRHVLIVGDGWKLKWPETETKNRKAHEVVLVGEARAIVERAWANRLPDCDLLFHVGSASLTEAQGGSTLRGHPRRPPAAAKACATACNCRST